MNARMGEIGMDKAELSRASGVNYDSVNKYSRGDVENPRGDALARIARALGLSEIQLRDGIQIDTLSARAGSKTHLNKRWNAAAISRILELDFRAGSGGGGMDAYNRQRQEGGILVSDDAVSAEWGIPAAFLRGQLRVNPEKAWIVEIYGDSMYDPNNPAAPGSLFPGDRVIVDTGDIRPSPPGAFAVHDGVGLVIKLVEVVPRSEPVRVRLSSRNPSYSPYEIAEGEGHIVGRVRARITPM